MDSGEREMIPVTMTIINPQKEYLMRRGSNQRPPVLKSTMLPIELLGSAQIKVLDPEFSYMCWPNPYSDWENQPPVEIEDRYGIILQGRTVPEMSLVFVYFDWSIHSAIFVYSVDVNF